MGRPSTDCFGVFAELQIVCQEAALVTLLLYCSVMGDEDGLVDHFGTLATPVVLLLGALIGLGLDVEPLLGWAVPGTIYTAGLAVVYFSRAMALYATERKCRPLWRYGNQLQCECDTSGVVWLVMLGLLVLHTIIDVMIVYKHWATNNHKHNTQTLKSSSKKTPTPAFEIQ